MLARLRWMIATVSLFCVTPAFAQITEMNLYAPADALAAWDVQTRLQWVDLPETLGLSYNDVLASDLVTVRGFRHATAAEVETLFLNAGFLTTDNVNDPLNDPAADLLLDVMGCTQFCGTVNELGRGFADYSPGWTVRPNYHSTALGSGAAVVSLFSSNFDLVDATAGHFLVRYIPPPQPGCGIGCELALVIPLLAGLRRWARR